jgi:hypothetical protein
MHATITVVGALLVAVLVTNWLRRSPILCTNLNPFTSIWVSRHDDDARATEDARKHGRERDRPTIITRRTHLVHCRWL